MAHTSPDDRSTPPLTSVLWRFLYLLLLVAIAAVLIGWPTVATYESTRESIILKRETGFLTVAEELVKREYFEAIGDIRTLEAVSTLHHYLSVPQGSAQQAALQADFGLVARAYKRYDSIRLVDRNGMETMGVDYRDGAVSIVQREQLRDQSAMPHIAAGLRLAPHQVYVSPVQVLDEPGGRGSPHVYFAIPTHDNNNFRKGLLVLRMQASVMVGTFQDIMNRSSFHQAMLLGSDGRWLSMPSGMPVVQPAAQPQAGASFADLFPKEWKVIQTRDSGTIRNERGLFLFSTIYPLRGEIGTESSEENPGVAGGISNSNAYSWKAVIQVSPEQLAVGSLLHQRDVQILVLLAALLLITTTFLAAAALERTARDASRRETLAAELSDLYENAPHGYHSLNSDGLIVRMNQTELKWLGYSRDEIVEKMAFNDLLTPDSRKVFAETFPQFKKAGEIHDLQLEVMRKDGTILPILVNATAIRHLDGRFVVCRTVVIDISEQRRLQQALEHEARTDSLTGLFNRNFFYTLADREIARVKRNPRPLSLLYLDIDHFKDINDLHGHHMGDVVLKAMSELVARELRTTDIFARLGGEEFAILLPEADLQSAQLVASRLCKLIGQSPVADMGNVYIRYTVSIGVTQFSDRIADLDAFLSAGDNAMYRAKAKGRNRVEVAA